MAGEIRSRTRTGRLGVVKDRKIPSGTGIGRIGVVKEFFQERIVGEKRKTSWAVGGGQKIKRTVVSDSKLAAGEGKSVQTEL